jgi:hypothetical protein
MEGIQEIDQLLRMQACRLLEGIEEQDIDSRFYLDIFTYFKVQL